MPWRRRWTAGRRSRLRFRVKTSAVHARPTAGAGLSAMQVPHWMAPASPVIAGKPAPTQSALAQLRWSSWQRISRGGFKKADTTC